MTESLSNLVTTMLTKAKRKAGRKAERKAERNAEMPNNPTEASLACQEPPLVAPERQGYLQARLYRVCN